MPENARRPSLPRRRSFGNCRARHPGTRSRLCANQGPGLRRLPQRLRNQGRPVPGIQYPRVPGHEVIGVIDAVGSDVPRWKAGQRVGVGWNGGYCGYCDNCRRGDFFTCQTSTDVTGVTRDGGYAEYMLAPISALALVPDELVSADAAPLMCAGVTTFNCLRNSWRAAGRPGRRRRHRRARSSRRPVRGQDGLQNGRHRARNGRRAAGPAARRALSHRQQDAGSCGRTAEAGRREGDPRHRHQRRRHEGRCSAVLASTAS